MKQIIKVFFVSVTLAAFISCGNNGGNVDTESDGWVDLGLPSGLLWATCNVGATMPADHGGHYAWGEIEAKFSYNWSNYAFGEGPDQLTKYCSLSSSGLNRYTDTLTILQSDDDIAAVHLGDGAHIPTADEWNELINNTTAEWTTINGISGRKFTASNGNSIFLPADGYCWGQGVGSKYINGYYWSSSIIKNNPCEACVFAFSSSDQSLHIEYGELRCGGLSVRAVRARQD